MAFRTLRFSKRKFLGLGMSCETFLWARDHSVSPTAYEKVKTFGGTKLIGCHKKCEQDELFIQILYLLSKETDFFWKNWQQDISCQPHLVRRDRKIHE